MTEFKDWDRVRIISGRLKGEEATVIGFSCLNMDSRVVILRDNAPRRRKRTYGIAPWKLKYIGTTRPPNLATKPPFQAK